MPDKQKIDINTTSILHQKEETKDLPMSKVACHFYFCSSLYRADCFKAILINRKITVNCIKCINYETNSIPAVKQLFRRHYSRCYYSAQFSCNTVSAVKSIILLNINGLLIPNPDF